MRSSTRREFIEVAALGSVGLALGCRQDASAEDGDRGDRPVAPGGDDPDEGPDTDTLPGTSTGHTGAEPVGCEETPPNPEGPFYLPGVPIRDELDLYGDLGDRLTIRGTLADTTCAPLAGAVVELWHAYPAGQYDNESPEMRYRGQIATGADGGWRFHTLMPGKYPGRPLHLHMKFWVDGVERLTTQVYFAGQPNGAVAPELVVDLVADGEGAWSAVFDVVV